MAEKKGIIQRLEEGVVIGDGGFVFELEKRGFCKAGPWTPEATIENPEAVRELHREFLRAGSDVMQAFTFYASDDKLENRANQAAIHGGRSVNQAACELAREVANEGDALVLGGLSQTPAYLSGLGEEAVKAQYRKQLDVFVDNKVDFLLAEYFEYLEEAVWAVEVLKESSLPVACSLAIGPEGDMAGVTPGDCAVRLVKAGAEIVGVNCHFDPFKSLETVRLMMEGIKAAGLSCHYMCQPLGYHTPDAGRQGFIDLPEFPFALEPRTLTRWDCHRYARDAYNLGVRYIGACCGMQPYHVRAISEELEEERGGLTAKASEKHGKWGDGLRQHTKPWVRARAQRDYWETLKPASGRPTCPSTSTPDNWGVKAGDDDLKQKTAETADEELAALQAKQKA
ncbi:betaine--homocysteine S-methyltransferase 1-like [Sycon ciliatum]|uniref:betaine--homocysteine S-methyltransferase 1-like n=1 Tax=Sycon ciliatum TaxID=27933 RepID=UPI0020ABB3EF|eukprot:scpid66491/ scgid30328/ Betaine--homocysteine S-methyltransferase 1